MTIRKEALQRDTDFGFIDSSVSSERLLNPLLVANDESNTMLAALRSELSTAQSFIFSVAFVTNDGLGALKQSLVEFKGRGTIITSDYLDFNDPEALEELLKLENVETLILNGSPHHAKGYIFDRDDHTTAIVGSSNLTRNALMTNREWNLRFSTHSDGDIADQLLKAVERQVSNSVPLTLEWIEAYEKRRQKRVFVRDEHDQPLESSSSGAKILPNAMQTEALENLQAVIDAGENKALIISATGTGKTILSALAVRQSNPSRVLFVAHREQILTKAAQEFKRVLEIDDSEIGLYVGSKAQLDRKIVFATIQTLSRQENLIDIPPHLFDYIVIDEVHRSGAETYRRVINHFRPDFLLGLTATPERTDQFNVYELFDYNVPYEIRLSGALEARMLVPFDYYGVSDYQSVQGLVIDDESNTEELISAERIQYVARTLETYGFPRDVKGLIFCSGNVEAQALSEGLNQEQVFGRTLRTVALSGSHSISEREAVIARLEHGEIDYIITVDIFNEGIDIPPVNQVVMLRATQSSIIFTQQLGRGLRKAAGKSSMRVIDFIGNYANNYLIPIALTGVNSGSKERIGSSMRRALTDPIAGQSTISFDEVSTSRVLESLQKARLNGKREARQAILNLRNRLGKLPRLIDFENHESMSPVLVSKHEGNYWSFLHQQKLVDLGPSKAENYFLRMLTAELLNGKRPQELLLLKELLIQPEISVQEYVAMLDSMGLQTNENCLRSVEKILDLSWFTTPTQKSFGEEPLVVRNGNMLRLSSKLAGLYSSYSTDESPTNFRTHVDDIIATGLLLNRKYYKGSDQLQPGERYSRKDACRLLNWPANREGTIFGYRTDEVTQTCPIFVTYHKDPDVAMSQSYSDELIDQSTMHWYSRHSRDFSSVELEPILSNRVDLHLFVKREDAEGNDFYYLGQVKATNPKESSMPGNKGEELDVVTTDLKLTMPIPTALFNSLTARKTVAAPSSSPS